MKEKESEQTKFTDDLENDKSKRKIMIISIANLVLLMIIVILLILLLRRQVPQYTITFDSNGGSLVETITVNENSTIPKPEDPIREGYKFVGWYYNDELYDFTKPVTMSMTLEAKWTKLGNVSENFIEQKTLTLNIGDAIKIFDIFANLNKQDITWENSASDIISIDNEGNIKALKEGTATITVNTTEGKYAITITVKATTENESVVNVTGVSLNKKALTLKVGQSSKLIATVNPSNATNKDVIWKSSNSNIVSVDAKGNIKALKEGKVTITVTTKDGAYTAKATITVNAANTNENVISVTGVTLNSTSLTLTQGESSKLTATVNPSNATNKNVTWESSNSNIVSVDSNGNIKALQPGSATITVITKDGNYKATCQVTVKEKPASYSVIFTPYEEVAGVYQYSVAVTKNNSAFNGYKAIIYNGDKVGNTLSALQYNENIKTATIRLNDGTDVTATVVYKK